MEERNNKKPEKTWFDKLVEKIKLENKTHRKFWYSLTAVLVILVILSNVLLFGAVLNNDVKSKLQASVCPASGLSESNSEPKTSIMVGSGDESDSTSCQSYLKFKEIKSSVTPSGIPDVYGEELGISFDQVQDAIDKVQVFGPTYGVEGKKIILTGDDLERYKKIGESIACEYCCGVKTLTKEDGSAACGCAHSIMMRGLAAYLIKNHPTEFTDEEILEELKKWKATYFPKQTLTAKFQELEKSGETGIKELLEEFPDFLPQMVGGC